MIGKLPQLLAAAIVLLSTKWVFPPMPAGGSVPIFEAMTSPKVVARAAGSLYLGGSVCFILAMSVRSSLIKGGDASGSAGNLRSSASLFRASLASDLVCWTCFLLVGMALYVLLNHVHRMAAGAMVVFVAVQVAVGYLNDVNLYAALTVATDADYAKAFGAAGSNALVMLSAQTQRDGLLINEMFWGLWLFPLGYLVIRSRQFPGLVGYLLVIAGISWIAQFFANLLAPGLPYVFEIGQIGGVGELVFMVWLIIFGVRLSAASAPASAMATSPES